MTAMSEVTEDAALRPPAEPEFLTADAKDEKVLAAAFKNILAISQDVGAASEETEDKEKLGQKDGVTPADESVTTESKWAVGAQCKAVWSEDGLLYPAEVLSMDGERCRVRFTEYGNEADVELGALKSPDAALQTQQSSTDWKPGSLCRAVYSDDGLVYPAVILWVKGQRCRVRFNDYNNEEEKDVGSLLRLDELHGPCRAKGGSWKPGVASSSSEWSRRKRDMKHSDRRGQAEDQQKHSWQVKDKPSNHTKEDKDPEEKPTNHSFSFFPPFPPPQLSFVDPASFIPPPPLLTLGGKDGGINTTSSMLMLWYTCGFHTGSYMAQQEFLSRSHK